MLISGIRNYSDIYTQNISDKVNTQEQINKASEANVSAAQPQLENFDIAPKTEEKPFVNTDDFASRYNANATFELKGRDSDIAALDETPNIANVMKQQIARQYSVFVGGGIAAAASNMAAVRPTEDFSI